MRIGSWKGDVERVGGIAGGLEERESRVYRLDVVDRY